jgi:glycosyltransferase involved in cell wall biosynthesis
MVSRAMTSAGYSTATSTAPLADKKLKVAFVVHPFWSWGLKDSVSTHIWVHEVARNLAKTCSTIVYVGRGDEPVSVEVRDGVEYRRISIWSQFIKRIPLVRKIKDVVSFESSWYYWSHALQIALDVRAQKCDVIHILNLSQFAPIIRALNPDIKIVLHMHAEWLTRISPSKIRPRLAKVDLILSVCDFVTQQTRAAFPEYAERCKTIYNGVDVERFFPDGKTRDRDRVKRLLYVGVVSPHKGLHILMDALPAVIKRYPKFKLDIVGQPYLLPLDWLPTLGDPKEMEKLVPFYDGKGYMFHLQERINRLNLSEHVVFSGLIPREELAQRYQGADIFTFASLWNELFGMPTAEAMACGVPVVTSRIAGLPEVVADQLTGFLVTPGDSKQLAEAILRLLEDESLRESMGRAGVARVMQHFTWEKITQDLMQHFRAILGSEAEQVGLGKTQSQVVGP